MAEYIARKEANKWVADWLRADRNWHPYSKGKSIPTVEVFDILSRIPAADVLPIPDGGIGEVSDGYHTFNGLYYQRMVLFAALVKQNKDKAWKSLRHEDGELCFGGGWFIVGIDTPSGSYTYHYEDNFWSMFDCQELPVAKHWDGHTEKDVTRLLSLADVQPVVRCKDCKHFHLDYFGEVNGANIIVAHEICDLWAGGCRTTQNAFCSNGVRADGEA